MNLLVVIPTSQESDHFLRALAEQGHQAQATSTGKLATTHFPALDITVAQGGLGKTQFAVHTQHLIEAAPWDWVICAGAAGALTDSLAVGDVVIATETVEHDIRNRFGKPLLPRFGSAETILQHCRQTLPITNAYQVHFGGIASGDEDVVELERRAAIYRQTGALVVAWEGAGGARACRFSHLPYLEIRGVSDRADGKAPADFEKNLPMVMRHVAQVVLSWVRVQDTRR
jgi:adenosylhomocysteine nucleosidase